jgi:hypothetical protein
MLWVWIQLSRGVLETTLCDKVCQWFSPSTPVSSTNKTDRHDIAEILKVALNTITLKLEICDTSDIYVFVPILSFLFIDYRMLFTFNGMNVNQKKHDENIYKFDRLIIYTVKPVYKGHTTEPENVAFMNRCTLYTGTNYMHKSLMGIWGFSM